MYFNIIIGKSVSLYIYSDRLISNINHNTCIREDIYLITSALQILTAQLIYLPIYCRIYCGMCAGACVRDHVITYQFFEAGWRAVTSID